MRAIPVLVTAVGGNVGQGIVRALRAARRKFRIVGVDMEPLSAGFAFVDAHYVVPKAGAVGFVERLCEIQRLERVEAVYVCSHAELEYFAGNSAELEELLEARVFVNPPRVVAVGGNKLHTVRFLASAGFVYPDTARAGDSAGVQRIIDKYGFPAFVKPCRGASAKHAFVVNSMTQLAAARELVPDLIVQRYLADEHAEYTAGTVSGDDGKVRAAIVLRRELLRGTTYRAELVEDESLRAEVVRVVEALGAIGPCNVQFRVADGTVYVFEINPRFSGTSGVRHLFGFNDAELTFALLREGQSITQPALRRGVVLRYWDEVHIAGAAFDDLRTEVIGQRGKQEIVAPMS